ncbi:hypothetical protein SEA_BANTAM_5 [Gordonia phage Bantam]|uniref:Uncharacterized protein n=1 Tax=Gordonia phage Bantam TaxID=1887641 RepID=A0A1B3AY69_9CAUD|nr:hypothetical protein BIZ77_gp005 [Gordonia phage Bantam]AOE43696.1 hypothetical protein SEA_BANTAM_5 [Gordonia phage Bantam]
MWVVTINTWDNGSMSPRMSWPDAFEFMGWLTSINVPAYARKVAP